MDCRVTARPDVGKTSELLVILFGCIRCSYPIGFWRFFSGLLTRETVLFHSITACSAIGSLSSQALPSATGRCRDACATL